MDESTSDVARFIDRAGRLYSLPVVAMQVLELTDSPNVDAAALKRCIENDPALTSKVLKVVNSSLFAPKGEVCDLGQALALLGTKPLKLLVLGFSLPERLFTNVAGHLLSHYWRRALTKAIAAREISAGIWKQPGEETFIAGLLADLGMLVLLQELGEPYVRFLDKVLDENGDLPALEMDALGFDHTALSAGLLRRWGLPATLTRAIAAPKSVEHLLQASGPPAQLARILHLAELLTQLVAEHRIGALPELLEAGKAYHDMTREQVTVLVENLEEKVVALAEVLSLELPGGMDYREVLASAHQKLAQVAADAAGELLRVHREVKAESYALGDAAARFAPDAVKPEPVAEARAQEGWGGLSDPGLLDRLTTAVASCRQTRCELSLLVAEIDRFEQHAYLRGAVGGQQLLQLLEAACRRLEHPDASLVRLNKAAYAVVLPDCDRRLAVELATGLVRSMHYLAQSQPATARDSMPAVAAPPLGTLSVGVASLAVPPKNFAPETLVDAARRCLYGAQSSGGNMVKSIEIY